MFIRFCSLSFFYSASEKFSEGPSSAVRRARRAQAIHPAPVCLRTSSSIAVQCTRIALLGLLAAGVPGLRAQDGAAAKPALAAVAEADNRFAVDLYRTLNEQGTGNNIFVSPTAYPPRWP
jgi:hypothetical protein